VVVVKVGQDESLEVLAGFIPRDRNRADLVAGLDVDVDSELEARVPPVEPALGRAGGSLRCRAG
jgi:hypothetical protein